MTNATSITPGTLIAADKVNGTSVYNPAGEKIGSVDDIMIDKISGRVIYAVVSFGSSFLGMGMRGKHYPIPWTSLNYDARQGGYLISLDNKVLDAAPHHDRDAEFKWTPEYGRKVDSYYKAPSYWS